MKRKPKSWRKVQSETLAKMADLYSLPSASIQINREPSAIWRVASQENALIKMMQENNARIEAFWSQIDYEQYYRSQVPE